MTCLQMIVPADDRGVKELAAACRNTFSMPAYTDGQVGWCLHSCVWLVVLLHRCDSRQRKPSSR
jgi:hypothetical protein